MTSACSTSRKWWTALKGAAKYATLPDRTDDEALLCARVCAECPDLKRYRAEGLIGLIIGLLGEPRYWTCGEQFDETDRNCGCIVLAESLPGDRSGHTVVVKINGNALLAEAAAKTTKKSPCPQGKFA